MLEMQIVIRTVLTRCELERVTGPFEVPRRRNITVRPAGGALATFRERGAAARDRGVSGAAIAS